MASIGSAQLEGRSCSIPLGLLSLALKPRTPLRACAGSDSESLATVTSLSMSAAKSCTAARSESNSRSSVSARPPDQCGCVLSTLIVQRSRVCERNQCNLKPELACP